MEAFLQKVGTFLEKDIKKVPAFLGQYIHSPAMLKEKID